MRPDPVPADGHTQGVRQRIVRIFKQRNESGFTVARSVPHADERMRRSVFCLAPSGFGWGSRIVETIVSGCIPVVVQDSVYQPGHDVLPYDDFSVRGEPRPRRPLLSLHLLRAQ